MASEKVTFRDCVAATLETGFVEEWMRLRGVKMPTNPLDAMIDDATGHGDEIAKQYLADVYDLVWLRLPPEVRSSYQ